MPTEMTILAWRRHFANCEQWMDFVREIHKAAGLPEGTITSPEFLVLIVSRMHEDCASRSAERAAAAIRALEAGGSHG